MVKSPTTSEASGSRKNLPQASPRREYPQFPYKARVEPYVYTHTRLDRTLRQHYGEPWEVYNPQGVWALTMRPGTSNNIQINFRYERDLVKFYLLGMGA